MRTLCLAAVLALAPFEQALAWGQEGHSIVAEIAQRRLEPATLEKIYKLLRSELPGLKSTAPISLSSIASWADDYRPQHEETRNWHFVDIPYDRDDYRPAEDCRLDPQYGDCAINAIARVRQTLADCTKPNDERVAALKFLVHFIGDIHQPLHAITRIDPDTGKEDQGGNTIQVTFFDKKTKRDVSTDLHTVWDTHVILHKVYDWGEYVRLIETEWLPGKDIAALQAGDPVAWVLAAHRAAVEVSYNFRPDHVLDEEYFRASEPIVDQQLALAGVRLARVLNETLQPTGQCR
jgi:hypothetical protein